MGISVQVLTYTRVIEASSTHPAISDLCARAAETTLSLLGWVDPHDDTIFNRSQLRALIPELRTLAEPCSVEEREAAEEILALAALVDRQPHRYLIFNGN